VGAQLRSEGWSTVAALESEAEAAALGCSHIWADGAVHAA